MVPIFRKIKDVTESKDVTVTLPSCTSSWWASLLTQIVKNLPAMQEPGFDPRVRKIPWKRAGQPTPVFLPGKSPWTEEPGGLQSMGSQRVGHN